LLIELLFYLGQARLAVLIELLQPGAALGEHIGDALKPTGNGALG
jgi:hypothetical protein